MSVYLRIFFTTYFFTLFHVASSREIYVGLFYGQSISKLEISIENDSISVFSSGIKVYDMTSNVKTTFEANGDLVKAIQGNNITGKVFLVSENKGNKIRLKGNDRWYAYKGKFLISAKNNQLQVVNIVDIDEYLGAVIRSEIGRMDGDEFLKAMAVVSRTYALRNTYKHANDNFDLCDVVHCQVYTGYIEIDSSILKAVLATEDEVVITKEGEFANTVFHANSGGITADAEHAWNIQLPYLNSHEDTFSLKGRGTYWKYQISADAWRAYLSKKVGENVDEYYCETEFGRRGRYYCKEKPISLAEVRRDLGLRSTLFIMEEDVDTLKNTSVITFYGRGYGHGVGLSQEGAYYMGLAGYSYEEIIKFYYSDVSIANYMEPSKIRENE